MEQIWEKKYTLRAGDFDTYNRILPSAVLELFQDAAGQHAETLGVGFEAMLKRSLLWVLVRVKFEILEPVKPNQTVVVKTWPLTPQRLHYNREYTISDATGKRLIVGSSEWTVIHSRERRLVSAQDIYPFADGFYTETVFDSKIGKVPAFEADGEPYVARCGFCDLDRNDHVNNTKYANYALNAICPEETDVLQSFQIDYRKEALHGARLNIFSKRENGAILVKGENEESETVFACRLDFKTEK